jgi:hypothetical protein
MKPAGALLLLGAAAALCVVPLRADQAAAAPLCTARQPCSPAVLHRQLLQLQSVLARCSASRSPSACNAGGAAGDAVVLLPGGPRPIDFAWLRTVLADAPKSKAAAGELKTATARLQTELAELSPSAPGAGPVAPVTVRQDHAKLRGILDDGDFQKAAPPSLLRRLWDDFLQWLSNRLQRMAGTGSAQRWFVPVLLLALLGGACGGLVWWFSRATRRGRLLSPPERAAAGTEARAEQHWEVWLQQARRLADEQRWRESIHRVYWAAIAQLESRGVWRADKARTPREYLALLELQSGRRGDLLELTRCMEGFWYGGRPAGEQDYARACALFDKVTAR